MHGLCAHPQRVSRVAHFETFRSTRVGRGNRLVRSGEIVDRIYDVWQMVTCDTHIPLVTTFGPRRRRALASQERPRRVERRGEWTIESQRTGTHELISRFRPHARTPFECDDRTAKIPLRENVRLAVYQCARESDRRGSVASYPRMMRDEPVGYDLRTRCKETHVGVGVECLVLWIAELRESDHEGRETGRRRKRRDPTPHVQRKTFKIVYYDSRTGCLTRSGFTFACFRYPRYQLRIIITIRTVEFDDATVHAAQQHAHATRLSTPRPAPHDDRDMRGCRESCRDVSPRLLVAEFCQGGGQAFRRGERQRDRSLRRRLSRAGRGWLRGGRGLLREGRIGRSGECRKRR